MVNNKLKLKRIKPVKPGKLYHRVWRELDGAIMDCFKHHPEYVVQGKMRSCRESLIKRTTGAVMSFLEQSREGRTRDKTGGS